MCLNKSIRKIEVRNIHPSHFGRLCPVETPEGQNAGIVNSPRLTRRLSKNSHIQTSVIITKKELFKTTFEKTGMKPQVLLLTSRKKCVWVTQFVIGLLRTALGQIHICCILRYYDTEIRHLFSEYRNHIQLLSIGSEQILALGPNLIPFLEHDDGNRVLIGANMLRQSLSLLKVFAKPLPL